MKKNVSTSDSSAPVTTSTASVAPESRPRVSARELVCASWRARSRRSESWVSEIWSGPVRGQRRPAAGAQPAGRRRQQGAQEQRHDHRQHHQPQVHQQEADHPDGGGHHQQPPAHRRGPRQPSRGLGRPALRRHTSIPLGSRSRTSGSGGSQDSRRSDQLGHVRAAYRRGGAGTIAGARSIPFARREARPVRLAVLDVGSNTVHLVVVDGRPDGTFVPVNRERDTLRLADAAFPGRFLPDQSVERLIESVKRKRAAADRLHAEAPRAEELASLRGNALALLGPLAQRVREQLLEKVCATSKTFRNLGVFARALPEAPTPAHEFGFAGIDGQTAPVLTREALNVVAGYIASSTIRDRARLARLDEFRAATLVAGSQVAALLMQAFGLRELVLAPWALREGVILDYLAKHDSGRAEPVEDPRTRSVLEFARRNGWDEPHSRQVTKLALSLFDQTAELHGLGPPERELLEVAGLLHDVGFAVAQSAHHKHSLYL